MDHSTQDIGALIRGARNARRLTQRQVGLIVGYSASAISRIEANKMRLDPAVIPLMARALGIPAAVLSGAAVPDGPKAATVATAGRPDEEDAMRRRGLLRVFRVAPGRVTAGP
ncbi:helix-turn-helix domain-containing protein [Streptomyces sp. V2]|uniref:helix-turn-helix domain-containing protein n=3 Tax=Streptomyces TaxID=1883 RepID=UPI001F0BB7EB|nr:helix-turn-helix transcriptional regulator [Streptomyces sp. V2]